MLKALVNLSLAHRLGVIIVALALSVYGVLAALALPVDVLPSLDRPTVSVLTEAPGLAPEEVEALVTVPIETGLSGTPNVVRVRSTSSVGLSIVHVEFGWGTEVYRNRQVVSERLGEIQERLPQSVTPHMGPISSIMGEVMLIGVTSDRLTPMQQREAAEWVIRPALLSIPGVASVTVQGGAVRQLQVKADPDLLRMHEVTLEQLEQAITQASASAPGGFVVSGSTEMAVRNLGQSTTPEQFAQALITTRVVNDHTVAVRASDVADVNFGPALMKRGDASMMANPAVVMAIAKQPSADSRELTRLIDERLAQLAPALPQGLIVKSDLFRQADFINAAVRNVI